MHSLHSAFTYVCSSVVPIFNTHKRRYLNPPTATNGIPSGPSPPPAHAAG